METNLVNRTLVDKTAKALEEKYMQMVDMKLLKKLKGGVVNGIFK